MKQIATGSGRHGWPGPPVPRVHRAHRRPNVDGDPVEVLARAVASQRLPA